MDAELVVRVVLTGAAVIVLLALPRAFRSAFTPPHRLPKAAFLAAMVGVCLWTAHGQGPGWFVPALYVDLGISAVWTLLAPFAGRRRARPADPLQLSHTLQRAARHDGPQWIGLYVAFTGSLFVIVAQPEFRQSAFTLDGLGCPLCFVEDQLRRILGDDTPAVAAYRAHLQAGSNRHVVLRRDASGAPWEVKMLAKDAYRRPPRTPSCPVHGPLTKTSPQRRA
ncbi:hypothetical protein [Streptomyces sp. NPDC049585]|uniref:hypothetical protein n=1 Tax=Streptomyces sp. NPDC049585 TaxID=3155154 RepID=UPI003437A08F